MSNFAVKLFLNKNILRLKWRLEVRTPRLRPKEYIADRRYESGANDLNLHFFKETSSKLTMKFKKRKENDLLQIDEHLKCHKLIRNS